ncbi:MAG TPA: DUF2752 domain-containing protein [Chitinophaga sp.]|uniref:DUF2752 domain-containing protein n=1 Tax=Chitinophaga sp. TaxID=1869181 RepID=UPI002BB4E572|nr:DUF2752 domain-containing protein [Chitinophaga sp.]HVI49234.1 DUF2752 domain-containing protein [Chitinophaga sp.]
MRIAFYRKINLELILWPTGLLLLFLMQPDTQGPSWCLFKNAGLPFCPGCGLGHGIHYFLHGQFKASLHHHWLAPAVTVILVHRIIQLARLQYESIKQL